MTPVTALQQHGTEVDHVPHAPPGDQRGDAERPFLTVLAVDDAGAGDVPVADRVIAGARGDPGRVADQHDDPDQARTRGPAGGCAARTSRVKSYQSRSCQSAAGYGIAFTCLYAATGKKAGRPNRGFPVVTASHRSAIAWRKAAEPVLGKARVCGRVPAPGATGSDTGDADWTLSSTVVARAGAEGLALARNRSAIHAEPWPSTRGRPGEPAPHPASRTAMTSRTAMMSAASGVCRDSLMPSPRHVRVLVPNPAETTDTAGQKCQWGRALWGHGSRVTHDRWAGDQGMGRSTGSHRPPGRWFDGAFAGPDAGPGRGLAGDRQGRGLAGRRADRLG